MQHSSCCSESLALFSGVCVYVRVSFPQIVLLLVSIYAGDIWKSRLCRFRAKFWVRITLKISSLALSLYGLFMRNRLSWLLSFKLAFSIIFRLGQMIPAESSSKSIWIPFSCIPSPKPFSLLWFLLSSLCLCLSSFCFCSSYLWTALCASYCFYSSSCCLSLSCLLMVSSLIYFSSSVSRHSSMLGYFSMSSFFIF